MDKKVPKPWCDPASGIYYTNFRVPTDLVPLVGRPLIQKSLRTKERRTAERKNCEIWLTYQREFERLRRNQTLNTALSEDHIPHLVEEWLHSSLKEDEEWRLMGIIPRTQEGLSEAYSTLAEQVWEGQQTGKHPEFLIRAASGFLQDKGVSFDSRGLAFAKFIDELSPRYEAYLNALDRRDRGERHSTPPPPKQPLTPLSKLVQEFIESRPKSKATALTKDAACMNKFVEIVSDKPMSSLKQQDLREFFQIAQRLPSQRGGPKKPDGITWREWAGEEVTMSPDTFKNNYLAPVRHFLKWAKSTYHDQGFPVGLTTDAIEYQGTRERGEDKQRAFTPEELRRLFLGEEMRGFATDPDQAARYWLPMLGLHTGARINELCQLNPAEDWITPDGIHCLHITTETESGEDVTKSIKTGTPRIVPIHPKLIELGFLDYLEQAKATGTGRLFPEFKPKMGKAGERAREWFAALIMKTGLRDDTPFAKVTGFHAFRHTLITYAANHEDASMEAAIDLITGHVSHGSAVKRGYISKRSARKAFETIRKVDFGLAFIRPEPPKAQRLVT